MTSRRLQMGLWLFPEGRGLGCVGPASSSHGALCTLLFVLSQTWAWPPPVVGQGETPVCQGLG